MPAIARKSRLASTLLALAVACGGESPGNDVAGETPADPLDTPARTARIAESLDAIELHLAAVESQGMAHPLLVATTALLAEADPTRVLQRPPFAISPRNLFFYSTWNRAVPGKGGTPRALDFEAPRHPIHVVRQYARALRERGIELLVVPIPRTPQIYPERLGEGLAPPAGFVGVDPGIAGFLAQLLREGIDVVHLTPHFAAAREGDPGREDRYLFHDFNNHWTPRAARLTAELVADRVRRMAWYEPGPEREGESWHRESERIDFELQVLGEKPRMVPIHVDRILNDAGEPAHRKDANSPVLLLSGSNALWYVNYGADVASHLYAGLGRRLDVIAIQGGASNTVWKSIARREGPGALADKKVVIWLFEANTLTDPKLEPVELFAD